MKSTKRLTLGRESVSDLTLDELGSVPGGLSGSCTQCVTVHVECPSDPITDCTVTQLTRFDSCIC